jgi:ATP-dependent Clp protease ATP-binding subunit ClpA
MLRGLKDRYEQGHGASSATRRSRPARPVGSRYIAGRQHPDKGVDLMDTAAARVKIAVACKPAASSRTRSGRIAARARAGRAGPRQGARGAGLDERAGWPRRSRRSRTRSRTSTARWKKEQDAAVAVIAPAHRAGGGQGRKPGPGRRGTEEARRGHEGPRASPAAARRPHPARGHGDVVAERDRRLDRHPHRQHDQGRGRTCWPSRRR